MNQDLFAPEKKRALRKVVAVYEKPATKPARPMVMELLPFMSARKSARAMLTQLFMKSIRKADR